MLKEFLSGIFPYLAVFAGISVTLDVVLFIVIHCLLWYDSHRGAYARSMVNVILRKTRFNLIVNLVILIFYLFKHFINELIFTNL